MIDIIKICSAENPTSKIEIIKRCLKGANELAAHIKQKYKHELSIKNKKTLPKWIYNNKGIIKALSKTRFEDVWGYIVQNTMPMKEAVALVNEKNFGHYNTTIKTGKRKGKQLSTSMCCLCLITWTWRAS